jgi:putative transposase
MLGRKYPVRVICGALGWARSSHYYQPIEAGEDKFKGAIERVLEEFPTYGYRRVTKQLRRHGWAVNHKRVMRLMRHMGLLQRVRGRRCKTTESEHDYPRYPNLVEALEVVRPNQVWVCDITYVRLHQEFIYLAVIMDVFSRGIRGWELSRSLDQSLTLVALKRALARYRAPEIHHSDQGVQYAATDYTELLEQFKVQISMAQIGCPEQNGYAERLMRTIKEEEVDLSDYEDYHDALSQIGRFLDEVYMHKRIHSSLGYLTPVEFEQQWRAQQHQLASSLKTA